MLKFKKTTLNIFIALFILVEIVLTVLVQVTSSKTNTVISFLAIVLACLFAFVMFSKTKDYILTQIALLTTVCADIFLVVLDPIVQIPAMIFFSITQLCYFIRIYMLQDNKKERICHLIIRVIVIVIALIATSIVLKENTDFLSMISMFYYANLLTNIIFSFFIKKNYLLTLGLIFFACCDLFIGLNVLAESYLGVEDGSLIDKLINIDFNIAWLFYVPSQTLLALSIYKEKYQYIISK